MTARNPDPQRVRDALFHQLPAAVSRTIAEIVDAGAVSGGAYLVGGGVRDLLIGRAVADIDLVTDGDAIDIMRRAVPGRRLVAHARFRTARVAVDGVRVDVATARSETYARPGALPEVTPAGIVDDLRRRDFSINAMALRLSGEPELVDPCGGRDDIERRWIRVLHAGSFIDDATRIVRAHRYAARLGFTIEPTTSELLAAAVGYVATISGARLRRELEITFEERTAGDTLSALDAAGGLSAVHSALGWDGRKTSALAGAADCHASRWALGFALAASAARAADAQAIVERLRLTRQEASAVRGIAALKQAEPVLVRPDAKPSGVVVVLDRYPPGAILAFAATTTSAVAGTLALRYLDEWRHATPRMTGADLVAFGVAAGPQVQQAMQLIRAARLDGWADSVDDERALAARFLKSTRDSESARPIDR